MTEDDNAVKICKKEIILRPTIKNILYLRTDKPELIAYGHDITIGTK
ncbi:MAG: hypothetical protein MSD82_01985 [Prevotella sp.]|nr:hypothetical protein [Prevotella sp.]